MVSGFEGLDLTFQAERWSMLDVIQQDFDRPCHTVPLLLDVLIATATILKLAHALVASDLKLAVAIAPVA